MFLSDDVEMMLMTKMMKKVTIEIVGTLKTAITN